MLNNLCANHWSDYDSFIKSDIKMVMIGKENNTVQKLISLKNHAIVRVEELAELSVYIRQMSDIISRSAYGKE